MKTNSYKKMAQRLYEHASAQGGYFTTKQAQEAGYAASTHSYNAKAKNWVREHRGIYRLANYPYPDRPDLIEWSLWSSNRKGQLQGVYSHQTALSLYDLSDVNPAKIYMTVPMSFRRSAPIPKVLVLHRAALQKEDIEAMHGFKVTRPLRAIADLLASGAVSLDHMEQAVKQAFQRGLIRRSQIEESERIPKPIKEQIEQLRKA
jgi:predicted transcriptional regulator of viral defense system